MKEKIELFTIGVVVLSLCYVGLYLTISFLVWEFFLIETWLLRLAIVFTVAFSALIASKA